MPSAPGYKRDLKREYQTAKARGEVGSPDAPNNKRMKLRREAMKRGLVKPGDGKDLAHKLAMSKRKSGGDKLSDVKVQAAGKNRSFARNEDGSMKSETSKREKK
jgi:hypothetical protein